jgi:hypothetical protein
MNDYDDSNQSVFDQWSAAGNDGGGVDSDAPSAFALPGADGSDQQGYGNPAPVTLTPEPDPDYQMVGTDSTDAAQAAPKDGLPPEYNRDLSWEDKQQLAKGGFLNKDEERMYGVKNWNNPVRY